MSKLAETYKYSANESYLAAKKRYLLCNSQKIDKCNSTIIVLSISLDMTVDLRLFNIAC